MLDRLPEELIYHITRIQNIQNVPGFLNTLSQVSKSLNNTVERLISTNFFDKIIVIYSPKCSYKKCDDSALFEKVSNRIYRPVCNNHGERSRNKRIFDQALYRKKRLLNIFVENGWTNLFKMYSKKYPSGSHPFDQIEQREKVNSAVKFNRVGMLRYLLQESEKHVKYEDFSKKLLIESLIMNESTSFPIFKVLYDIGHRIKAKDIIDYTSNNSNKNNKRNNNKFKNLRFWIQDSTVFEEKRNLTIVDDNWEIRLAIYARKYDFISEFVKIGIYMDKLCADLLVVSSSENYKENSNLLSKELINRVFEFPPSMPDGYSVYFACLFKSKEIVFTSALHSILSRSMFQTLEISTFLSTICTFAIVNDRLRFLEHVIKYDKSKIFDHELLELAITQNSWQCVHFLIGKGNKIHNKNLLPQDWSIRKELPYKIKWILQAGYIIPDPMEAYKMCMEKVDEVILGMAKSDVYGEEFIKWAVTNEQVMQRLPFLLRDRLV